MIDGPPRAVRCLQTVELILKVLSQASDCRARDTGWRATAASINLTKFGRLIHCLSAKTAS
jgi:hypothetical protein